MLILRGGIALSSVAINVYSTTRSNCSSTRPDCSRNQSLWQRPVACRQSIVRQFLNNVIIKVKSKSCLFSLNLISLNVEGSKYIRVSKNKNYLYVCLNFTVFYIYFPTKLAIGANL